MANIMYVVKFSDEAFSNVTGALEDFIASNILGLNTFAGDYESPYDINPEEVFEDYSVAKEYFNTLKALLADAGYKVEEKHNTLHIDEPYKEEYISLEMFQVTSKEVPSFASMYKAHKERMASVYNKEVK